MRAIEPQRSHDEYIDGLRVDEESPFVRRRGQRKRFAAHPVTDYDGRALTPKGVGTPTVRRSGRGSVVVGMALACVVGSFFGSAFTPRSDDPAEQAFEQPQPSTVTVTVEGKGDPNIPESCRTAVADAMKLFENAARISSANDLQLDIMTDAHVAMLRQDWQRLIELTDQQRQLQGTLVADAAPFGLAYESVMNGLATCMVQGSAD